MNGQSKAADTSEGDAKQSSACCNCREGCTLGENVYCSVDGRFHPSRDSLACENFIPKNRAGATMNKDKDED